MPDETLRREATDAFIEAAFAVKAERDKLRAQRDQLRECLEGLLDAMQTPAHKAEGVMRLPSQSRIDRARAALKECEQ